MNKKANWLVEKLEIEGEYILRLYFADGSVGLFDFEPYLGEKLYSGLKDFKKFSKAKVVGGSVAWGDSIDIAPEELYEKSIRK
jgi:DUF971 family protein